MCVFLQQNSESQQTRREESQIYPEYPTEKPSVNITWCRHSELSKRLLNVQGTKKGVCNFVN